MTEVCLLCRLDCDNSIKPCNCNFYWHRDCFMLWYKKCIKCPTCNSRYTIKRSYLMPNTIILIHLMSFLFYNLLIIKLYIIFNIILRLLITYFYIKRCIKELDVLKRMSIDDLIIITLKSIITCIFSVEILYYYNIIR